jgi:NTE family protein
MKVKQKGQAPPAQTLPGQTVLVLQGGGALGAYQVGVYQAMHERGIEPDWVIGTSIGAINAALIAGNRPGQRMASLRAFWEQVEHASPIDTWAALMARWWPGVDGSAFTHLATMTQGIPAFFKPNPLAWRGTQAALGVEAASWHCTTPLRATLGALVDFELLTQGHTRLTVGAVNVCNGRMRYFDSRDERLELDHVMASGALPPAFGAVRIEGQPYWDGGLYSNTPIEAVLDDKPRRDSVIFSVNVWQSQAEEPASIWQVMGRQKDIQYASRADSHIARQQQLHHLRHVIRELARRLPARERESAEVRELASWGCGTTMHVLRLLAPSLQGEDQLKDIDFTPQGIRRRWHAGHADTLKMIDRQPWTKAVDPMEGVVVHTLDPTATLSS